MDNAAKRRVTTVEFKMRRGVGRRTIFPFHHLTAHIDHHHIVCFHGFVGNAEPLHTPGIVVYQHGPFAWGKDAHDAVHNAVVMEEVAKMAWIARGINPQLNHIDSFLMNKHFMRKHGPNAYYGQK